MASQPPWDPSRFLNTLTFFDVLPFSEPLRQIGRWIQGLPKEQTVTLSPWIQPEWIVLAGLEESLCQSLISAFHQHQVKVRVVTAEAGGLSSRTPLLQEAGAAASEAQILSGVKGMVLGSQVDPERGQGLIETWQQLPERMIFDFSNPTPELRQLWGAVDDVVMGGVSQSALQVIEGMALFAGTVSTANNGGFASIRTRNFDRSLDLSGSEGLELRVRGDGKRYKLFLRTQNSWDSLAYGIGFDTEASQWMTVRLPFAEMVPVFRTKRVEDADPLDLSQIQSIQIMLSKFEFEKQLNPKFIPGPFALQLAALGAYGKTSDHPPLVLIPCTDSDPLLEKISISHRTLPWHPSEPETTAAECVQILCSH